MAKKRASTKQPANGGTHSFREYDAKSVLVAFSVYHGGLAANDDRYIDVFPDSILKGMTAIGGTHWCSQPHTADQHTTERRTCANFVRGFLLLAAEARSKGHHIDAERFSFQAGMFYERLPSKERFPSKAEVELWTARNVGKSNTKAKHEAIITELKRRLKDNPLADKSSHLKAMAKETIDMKSKRAKLAKLKLKWGCLRTLFTVCSGVK